MLYKAGGAGGTDETGTNKDIHQLPVISMGTLIDVPASFPRGRGWGLPISGYSGRFLSLSSIFRTKPLDWALFYLGLKFSRVLHEWDSVPDGSLVDPFQSCVCVCACVWVWESATQGPFGRLSWLIKHTLTAGGARKPTANATCGTLVGHRFCGWPKHACKASNCCCIILPWAGGSELVGCIYFHCLSISVCSPGSPCLFFPPAPW